MSAIDSKNPVGDVFDAFFGPPAVDPERWLALSWEAKRGAVLAGAGFICEICHDADAVEVDHIWPKNQGGTDQRHNLRAACRACNAKKADKIYTQDLVHNPHLAIQGVAWAWDQIQDRIIDRAIFLYWRDHPECGSVHLANWPEIHDLLVDLLSMVEVEPTADAHVSATSGVAGPGEDEVIQ